MDARNWKFVRSMAARDLGVEDDDIHGKYLGNERYELSAGEKSVEYRRACSQGVCGWLGDVRPRAEFDLACPRGELTVTTIDLGTLGVRGCGKQATYVSRQGKWLLNSAIAEDSGVAHRAEP